MDVSKKFEIVGTTADVAVVVYGASLQKLFANAAEGLTSIIADPDRVAKKKKKEVRISGSDLENLLVKWLSEVLYLFEVKEFVGKEFKVLSLDSNQLHAEITGESYHRKKHVIRTEVKAVTYHQLFLKQEQGKWKAKIIFDL